LRPGGRRKRARSEEVGDVILCVGRRGRGAPVVPEPVRDLPAGRAGRRIRRGAGVEQRRGRRRRPGRTEPDQRGEVDLEGGRHVVVALRELLDRGSGRRRDTPRQRPRDGVGEQVLREVLRVGRIEHPLGGGEELDVGGGVRFLVQVAGLEQRLQERVVANRVREDVDDRRTRGVERHFPYPRVGGGIRQRRDSAERLTEEVD